MVKKEILRVKADNDKIKHMYAKFSKFYGFIERFEGKLREKGLKLLDLQKGEIVLEVGFGRGTSLVKMARSVGTSGKIYGIDLTPEMVKLAKERVLKEGLMKRIELHEGDAKQLPYKNDMFDAVYIASTLELFDTPDIPIVLREIKRVLKPTGRLCVVSIPKEGRENSLGVKYYEWTHRTFQDFASCRPIYVEDSIKKAGFKIIKSDVVGSLFLMKIVIALL